MKIIGERVDKRGKRIVTVELGKGESVVGIRENSFYDLGEPLNGEVVASHVIAGIQEVTWCSVSQKWVP